MAGLGKLRKDSQRTSLNASYRRRTPSWLLGSSGLVLRAAWIASRVAPLADLSEWGLGIGGRPGQAVVI